MSNAYSPSLLLSFFRRTLHNIVCYNNDKCVPHHRQISFSGKCDTLPPIQRRLFVVVRIVAESYLLIRSLHLVCVYRTDKWKRKRKPRNVCRSVFKIIKCKSSVELVGFSYNDIQFIRGFMVCHVQCATKIFIFYFVAILKVFNWETATQRWILKLNAIRK